MFGSARGGANVYAKVSLETGVSSASPHSLIVMLFDGALISLSAALQSMKAGDVPAKGQAISKAITIIDSGLRASLNKEAGGEIAENLDKLYEYMTQRLLLANLKNQPELLEEVIRLIKDLKGAWEAMGDAAKPAPTAPVAANETPAAPAADPLAPRMSRLVKA
jgi:flagellar protein FliS